MLDLRAELDALTTTTAQRQAEEVAQREAARAAERERTIAELWAAADRYLDAELRAALEPLAVVECGNLYLQAHFEGVAYGFRPRRCRDDLCGLFVTSFNVAEAMLGETPEAVRTAFLAYLQRHHAETVRALDAERALDAARAARMEAEERGCALVAAARAAHVPWAWPAGAMLDMFHWRWCIAFGQGEEGAEYDEGWSFADRLDADGYVVVLGRAGDTRLRLLADIHLPVVRHVVLRGLDDVALSLRERVVVQVPGVADDADGYRADPDRTTHIVVGDQPITTIRARLS